MRLADLVALSASVAEASSRLTKVGHIADVLRALGPHYLWHADPALCTRTFLVLFVIVTAVLWHHERRTFAN